jgi:hypothetical protein
MQIYFLIQRINLPKVNQQQREVSNELYLAFSLDRLVVYPATDFCQ